MEETFELIEIYEYTDDKNAECYSFDKQKGMKHVATLVDGIPIRVHNDVSIRRRYITEDENNKLKSGENL